MSLLSLNLSSFLSLSFFFFLKQVDSSGTPLPLAS